MPEITPGSRDTNPNPVTEQQPHSGVHGYEKPAYDFEGQSLKEAIEKRDLHVEYDAEGRVIVPDSIGDHIDPIQTGRTEVYEPLAPPTQEVEEKTPAWKKWVAGVIGGSVLVGGGFAASQLRDNGATEPRVNPGVSGVPNPGEQTNSPENPAEPVTLEGIKTRPNAEQLHLAETPVTGREYPSAEGAYRALHERRNMYAISATMDFEADPVVETPESLESKSKLRYTIYGPNHESRPDFSLDEADAIREDVGLKFYYYYEVAEKEMTYRMNSEVTSIESTTLPGTTEAYVVHSTSTTETNLPELDSTETEYTEMINTTTQTETTIALAEDGNWYIYSIQNVG